MDTRDIRELLGRYEFGDKTQALIEKIRSLHDKGTDVTIICHKEDEDKAVAVVTATGMNIVGITYQEDENLLPKGKSIVVIQDERYSLSEKVEKAKEYADELEELLRRKELEDERVPSWELESRKDQREQMRLRSRFLSKHSRK